MKQGMKGSMNIDFSEHYDKEDDIYYVTFKTGEPSGVVELDDILLLEVGVFSGLPTGFRILNYSKHNVAGVEFAIKKIERVMDSTKNGFPSTIATRTKQVERVLEKTLQAA